MSHKILSNPASSSRLLSFPSIRIALVTFPHIQLLRHSKLCPILGSQLLLFFLPDTLVPIPSQGRLFLPFELQFNVIPLKTSSLTTLSYMAHLLLEMTSQRTFPFIKFFCTYLLSLCLFICILVYSENKCGEPRTFPVIFVVFPRIQKIVGTQKHLRNE